MSMWLCRAGSSGEFENKFLEENRIYCTWDNLSDVPFATSGGSGMGKTAQILSKMQQIALAWHWAKGVASPIVGGTKMSHYDDAADALDVTLTPEEVVYLEEPYLPHRVVGAVDHNPPEGVMLPDEKK